MPVTLVEMVSEAVIIGDLPGAADPAAWLSVIMSYPLSLRFKKESP